VLSYRQKDEDVSTESCPLANQFTSGKGIHVCYRIHMRCFDFSYKR